MTEVIDVIASVLYSGIHTYQYFQLRFIYVWATVERIGLKILSEGKVRFLVFVSGVIEVIAVIFNLTTYDILLSLAKVIYRYIQ